MLRKLILITIICMLILTNIMKINSLTKIADLDGGYTAVQGGCSDGEFFYYAKTTDEWAEIHKRKISQPFCDILCVREDENTKYRLGHCNDMTFDRKNNRIIVVSYRDEDSSTRGNLTFLDPETLTVISQIKVKNSKNETLAIVGIEILGNNYIGIDGSKFYMFDKNFNFLKGYSRGIFSSENLAKKYKKIYGEGKICTQGLAIDKEYIYYLSPYEYKVEGKKCYINNILRFTHSFEPVDEMQINVYSEAQNMFFIGKIGYIMFYNKDEFYTMDRNIFRNYKRIFDRIFAFVNQSKK